MKSTIFCIIFALVAGLGAAESRVVAVSVDGVVHPITDEIIGNALAQAEIEGAGAVLIRLNTPGGILDATSAITEKIVASPVPVITYVTPSGGHAASAGFFILQAGDIAAMAPGTRTGAASPVLMGQEMDPVMRRKVENDTSAALRSVVEKRGRNSELAEKTVLEAKAFTETEALESNLIELIAASESDLFKALDGREIVRFNGDTQVLELASPQVIEYQLTTRESFVSAIADPNIAFIILILGALGIYIEFSSPGLIAPGVAGGILVLLGLSALSVLPINWIGVALLVLAVVLFILEANFASHGILSVGGSVAMVLGALLLVEGPPEMRIRLGTALGVTLPFAAITVFLLTLIIRARSAKVVTGSAGMIGELGVAYTELNLEGRVFVHGEYWDAVAAAPVAAGVRIAVKEVDGLKLKVEPVQEEERSHD
jgi:membrane-bound serine protease (ClpP class)